MSSSDLDFGSGLGVCARVGTACDFALVFRVTGRGVVDLARGFAGSWICAGASATTGTKGAAAATAAAPPGPGGGPPDELLGVAKIGIGLGGFGTMCTKKALPLCGGGGGPPPPDGFVNTG